MKIKVCRLIVNIFINETSKLQLISSTEREIEFLLDFVCVKKISLLMPTAIFVFIDKVTITTRLSLPKSTDYIIICHFLWITMGRGTQLTAPERGRILAYKEENVSVPEFTKRLKRSQKVIQFFLVKPDMYGSHKPLGRPPVISVRELRAIKRTASNNQISSKQLQSHLNLSASRSTILWALKKSFFVHKKLNISLNFTARHFIERIHFL